MADRTTPMLTSVVSLVAAFRIVAQVPGCPPDPAAAGDGDGEGEGEALTTGEPAGAAAAGDAAGEAAAAGDAAGLACTFGAAVGAGVASGWQAASSRLADNSVRVRHRRTTGCPPG